MRIGVSKQGVYTTVMATVKCLVSLDTFRSKYYSDSAHGTRTYFILGSVAGSSHDGDVVPRRALNLTDEDRRILTNLGLPPDRWTDLEVLLARIKQAEGTDVAGEAISTPDNELSCEYVLKKLREFFQNSTDKDGAVVHYYGNGRRFKGDWCFKDGYITFRDMMEVYMEHYRGRVLTIISDCSYSGSWVKECYDFMDDLGVSPCGHCAIKKGILLKVFGSCKPNEMAATLCYNIRSVFLDKNAKKILHRGGKIGEKQNAYGKDFTIMSCGKKVDEPCALPPNQTWQEVNEASRVYLVRGKDRGKPAWHYVLLVDDEDTIDLFKEKVASGTVDVADYGQLLESGWGADPPNEVVDKIQKRFKVNK